MVVCALCETPALRLCAGRQQQLRLTKCKAFRTVMALGLVSRAAAAAALAVLSAHSAATVLQHALVAGTYVTQTAFTHVHHAHI